MFHFRCANPNDGTVSITKTQDVTKFQWQMESFRYFGGTNEIYIHCDVRVCISTSSNPQCSRCASRKRRDLSNVNGINGKTDETSMVSVNSGLIVLIDSSDKGKLINKTQSIKKKFAYRYDIIDRLSEKWKPLVCFVVASTLHGATNLRKKQHHDAIL